MIAWSKIGKLIGMLGSEHDGERLNAARLLDRTLRSEGASFGDLANRVANSSDAPQTIIVNRPMHRNPARVIAEKIIEMAGKRLTRSERGFLTDVIRKDAITGGWYDLSPSQANWLSVLEAQHCTPKPRVHKAPKPGPIPPDILDALGLGEVQGTHTGERVMPDASIDEAEPRSHKPVPDATLDEMGLGESQGTFKGDSEHVASVKRRFGNLDI